MEPSDLQSFTLPEPVLQKRKPGNIQATPFTADSKAHAISKGKLAATASE
jgi:hypothetical protein